MTKQSGQGIVRDERGQEQPADNNRAQKADKSKPQGSVSREATRDPRLNDETKTPGSGTVADDDNEAPTG